MRQNRQFSGSSCRRSCFGVPRDRLALRGPDESSALLDILRQQHERQLGCPRGRTFQENGLDVELIHIPSTSRAIQAMLAGEMAFSYTDGRTAVQAALKGVDVVMLAGAANRFVFSFMARPDIRASTILKARKSALHASDLYLHSDSMGNV